MGSSINNKELKEAKQDITFILNYLGIEYKFHKRDIKGVYVYYAKSNSDRILFGDYTKSTPFLYWLHRMLRQYD